MVIEQMGMRTVKSNSGEGVTRHVLQKSRGIITLRLLTREQMNQWETVTAYVRK